MRRYVVDTGMVKQKLYNAQTGLECLKVRTGPSYLSCAAVARRTRIPTELSFGCASMQAEDVRARLPGSGGSCLRLPLHPCLKKQHAAAVSAPLGRVPVPVRGVQRRGAQVVPVSKAAAKQRSGRAGRECAGHARTLYAARSVLRGICCRLYGVRCTLHVAVPAAGAQLPLPGLCRTSMRVV